MNELNALRQIIGDKNFSLDEKMEILEAAFEREYNRRKKAMKEKAIAIQGVGVSTSLIEKAKDVIGGIFELTLQTNGSVIDLNKATDCLYSFIEQNK